MPIYRDKKRNTWYFRVYVVDKNGKHCQKTKSGFKTKNECKQEESKFLLNYEDRKDDILFENLYQIYIKNKEQSLKFQSYRSLKNRFDTHIVPFFKDYKINNIKVSDYLDWKNYILSKNYSFPYCSSLHRAMVNILNFACDFYDLKENIAHKVGNFSSRDYKKKINFWTYDEFNIFISNIDDIVYYTLFDLLYYSGLRLGEALALNWNDLKDNYIVIDKTLIKRTISVDQIRNMKIPNYLNDKEKNNYLIENEETPNYFFNTPKTFSSIRNVKLDNHVLEHLNKLKLYYQNFIGFDDNWFIFGGIKPLSTTTIERKKNEYCKIANVKQIRIHDFRHSHATHLLSKGVPPTVIQKRLGHSNLSMTLNIYSHLILQDEDKAIELLNKIKS